LSKLFNVGCPDQLKDIDDDIPVFEPPLKKQRTTQSTIPSSYPELPHSNLTNSISNDYMNDKENPSFLVDNPDQLSSSSHIKSYRSHSNSRSNKPRVTEMAIDLLGRLLCFDPSKRISADKALCHPFFFEYPLPCPENLLPRFNPNKDCDEFAD
jgi:serine/threonine protein kinase